jgi:hypothetical protein
MGASSELFLRLTEREYFEIPQSIRESHLSSKIVSSDRNDWAENMKDEQFSTLYNIISEAKKQLSEREYQLREERREINK